MHFTDLLLGMENAAGDRKLQAHEESLSSAMHAAVGVALHKANGKAERLREHIIPPAATPVDMLWRAAWPEVSGWVSRGVGLAILG